MDLKPYFQFLRNLFQVGKKGQDFIRHHDIPLEFIHRRITRTQFLILSAILVGCTGGLAGVLLKTLVHYIHLMITQDYHFHYQLLFYFIFPVTGLLITIAIVKSFFGGDDHKGIPRVLHEIARKSSFVEPVKMYSQIILSAITVGFGGSAGLESPIAVTGAAIGSNYARTYRLDYRERTLLLAAGSAAGIASAFDAPIAGFMFAIEIILSGVVFSDFIPLIIASACGALISKVILNDQILLHFNLKQPFNDRLIPYYILLGIICGIYSRYYAIIAGRIDTFCHRFGKKTFTRGIVAGLILSSLCFLFPPLFGDGYGYVKTLADQGASTLMSNSLFHSYHNPWAVFAFVGMICLVKVFATTLTISGGGNGGNFAPSLFAGAFLGYFFASASALLHIHTLPLANFAIVAMAGVMSGVLYAPLTSIFLIAEVTGGYDLFIPLMIVSTASYLIVKRFAPYSVDTRGMASRGDIFTREADRNLLGMLRVKDLLDKDIYSVSPQGRLRDLVELVKKSHRSLFAVVDGQQELQGIITLDDIREVMFTEELYDTLEISQLMKPPPAVIQDNEGMGEVMKKFDQCQAWNLPVVEGTRFLGFISKSTLLSRYRGLLKDYS